MGTAEPKPEVERLKNANDVLRKQLQQFSRALDKSLQ